MKPLGGILGLAVCIAATSFNPPITAADPPTTTNNPKFTTSDRHIEGLWVWRPKYISDLAEQDQMLDFCTRQGFNRLLIQIPWKPGTAQVVHPTPEQELQAGTATHPEINYATEFARLIAEAAKRHIAIEALDGAPNMGDKAHWPETLATVDAIIAFNNTLPEGSRFAGVHWDIEPYVRKDWKDNTARVTIETDYLGLLAAAKDKLHAANLTLAVDIPMWYDHKTDPDDNCIVTYDGQTKNFHEHIQDLTDYVGIMSYRRNALGKNSAMEQIETELNYAEKIGKVVVPSFETIELKDTPQITFFGLDANALQGERKKLEDALNGRPGFGGMFIHHYASVRAMLEPTDATTQPSTN